MKNLNADTVLWLVANGAFIAMIFSEIFRDDSDDLPARPPRGFSNCRGSDPADSSARPRFIWGDWDLQEDDELVMHFRVEGALVWWLTVDGECARLKHATVVPKNFRSGQEGRIVMFYPGALDEPDDHAIEFGIRYCTTDGHIETQSFEWRMWREPAPVPRDLVLVA